MITLSYALSLQNQIVPKPHFEMMHPMHSPHLDRRQFLRTTLAASAAATGLLPSLLTAASPEWEIGCFNRPWSKWSYDDALDQLKIAGFKTTGLVGNHQTNPESLLSYDSRLKYLTELKERIHSRGIKPLTAWIRGPKAKDHDGKVKELKALVDRAAHLGLPWLLSGGPRTHETVEEYAAVTAVVARHAADKGVKIAMKPHGGDGAEIEKCLSLINHDNFSIWYDAGNIVYYTGRDPVKELKSLAPHVTGFCAKDCEGQKSPVMIQFGDGKVDFKPVFQILKDAGFNGPVMIECTGTGDSPEATRKLAEANRKFLKKTFDSLS